MTGLRKISWLLGAATCITVPALAQTVVPDPGASAGLEDIVVTAQRRSENLQDTPISIAALGAAQLEQRGVTNIADLQGAIPGLGAGGAGGSGSTNSSFTIRGVSQPRNAITAEPGVALYVDGIYIGRSEGGLLDVIDAQRIEVLRGPQGTLFGKNAVGGAIHIITREPERERGGDMQFTLGNFSRLDARGSFNLPVGDIGALRISGSHVSRNGHVRRNADNLDIGDRNTDAVRAQLRLEPSADLRVDLSADYSSSKTNGAANVLVATFPQGEFPTFIRNNGGEFDDRFIADSYRRTNGTGPAFASFEAFGASAQIQWSPSDAFTIKSLTGYREIDYLAGIDLDGAPVTIWHQISDRTGWQFTQEFQFSGNLMDDRLKWVTGLFYLADKPDDDRTVFLAIPAASDRTYYQQKTDSYAVFGQTTFSATDRLDITLGARYGYEKKKVAIGRLTNGQTPGLTVFPDPFDPALLNNNQKAFAKDSWENVSLRAAVDYDITDEVMVYASFARGFKSGGFSDRLRPNPNNNAITPYDEERNDTYELGIRSELFDRRLRLNATYYRSEYKDVQVTTTGFVAGAQTRRILNAGDARIDGVEAEMVFLPVRGLRLEGSVAYMDARYVSVAPGVVEINLDTPLPRSPKWSYTVSGQYDAELGNGSTLSFRVDWNWLDDFNLTGTEQANVLIQDSYGLLNGRIAYTLPGDAITFAVFGTNLTDKQYLTSGLLFTEPFGLAQGEPGRPREWGVSASFRF